MNKPAKAREMETPERSAARARAAKMLKLSEAQIEEDLVDFLIANGGDVVLRARAGSGKSTALTIKAAHLIEDLGVEPSRIAMLTFNNAAARSLEGRLSEAGVRPGVRVRTFHALAQRIVRAHFGGSRKVAFDAKSEEGQLIAQLMEESIDEVVNERFYHYCASKMRTRYDKRVEYVESVGREALLSAVNFLRARGYGLQNKLEDPWKTHGPIGGNAWKVILGFENRLREARLLDGVMVLQAAGWTLEREIETGVMRPSEAHDCDWLFIDEYQDVSLPYMRLVSAIRNLNGMVNVQCVGDDWQAINGFAGAELTYFTEASEKLDEPEMLELLRNRRSGSDIVSWGNKVMAGAGYPDAPAIPAPNNGSGQVRRERVSAERDFMFVAEKLADMVNPKQGSVALIARKWTVGQHGLSKLAREVAKRLAAKGFTGKVTGITAHGSKGLEYDEVLLLDDGSFPMQHPSRPILEPLIPEDEFQREEACLRHVAGTRARQSLIEVSM